MMAGMVHVDRFVVVLAKCVDLVDITLLCQLMLVMVYHEYSMNIS